MEESNPFKKIETKKKVPKTLKKKVLNDVSITNSMIELGDLFFLKLPRVVSSIINVVNDENQESFKKIKE